MQDLSLAGYTVGRFQSVLQPEVNDFTGESDKGMAVLCNAAVPDDRHGVLRYQISIAAYLPGDQPLEDRTPFVVLEGDFYFSFESFSPMSADDMVAALKTTGVQVATPVLRGVLVGVSNLMNLPQVFSFPPVNPEDIEWEDSEPEA